MQVHQCLIAEQQDWLLRSGSVIPANKVSLQELSQLIGIKLLPADFGFSRNFWFLGPISGRQMLLFPPLRTPMLRDSAVRKASSLFSFLVVHLQHLRWHDSQINTNHGKIATLGKPFHLRQLYSR